MLGFLVVDDALLAFLERLGGAGIAAICALLALVCTVVWNTAFFYFRFGAMQSTVADIRKQMVTRDGLALVLGEMEKRLTRYAEDRFLTRQECAALIESRERFGRGENSC